MFFWSARGTLIPDHYKAMHSRILTGYLTQAEFYDAEPNYPKSANRYRVTFADGATADKVNAAVKAKPYACLYNDDGEWITVRASWPQTPEQQARGRLSKPVYSALNVGDLEGHLRLSYPKGPRPATLVSVGMARARVPWKTSFGSPFLTTPTIWSDFGTTARCSPESARSGRAP